MKSEERRKGRERNAKRFSSVGRRGKSTKGKFATFGSGILLFFFMLIGCSEKNQDTFSHESAQQAAKRYYTHFTQGDAKQFVEGMVNAESFSEDYRMQMQDVIAHAAKELTKRGGVVRIEALSDSLYAADSTAYVFLDLVFADSIHEQVGLPMVFRQSKWRMK